MAEYPRYADEIIDITDIALTATDESVRRAAVDVKGLAENHVRRLVADRIGAKYPATVDVVWSHDPETEIHVVRPKAACVHVWRME